MQQTATAPPPTGPARTWEATYPGTADQVRHVRAALWPLLRDCPAADDIILLVDELAANAILFSASGRPGGTFTVRLQHIPGDHVRAEVQDRAAPGTVIWPGQPGARTACTSCSPCPPGAASKTARNPARPGSASTTRPAARHRPRPTREPAPDDRPRIRRSVRSATSR